MTPAFNLLDEQWLPVRFTDGTIKDVGLIELFERAGQITALAETSPPSLIACYRILLAITHRALTRSLGAWKEKDRARWHQEGLPQAALQGYLQHWRDRFWLFHPEYPFMQVAALAMAEETRDKRKPWTQISLANASGNSPVVFDHSVDEMPKDISAAVALRALLGFLQFTPGGLVKVLRSSDKAGPLANTAAVLPVGATLNETVCLSLHPASLTLEDVPAWEYSVIQIDRLNADPMPATGRNDLYSRLSRAVLFLPEEDGRIRWVRFAAGLALEADSNAPDAMVSFRAGSNSLIPLGFREGRALWRDLPTLVPDAEGKACQPASVLGWAVNLQDAMGRLHLQQSLLVAGLASDQAKLLRWRSEEIALPASFLQDARLGGYLREQFSRAEELYGKLRSIAIGMYAATMPDPNNKETRTRVREMIERSSAAGTFFSFLERKLPELLGVISEDLPDNAYQMWSEYLLQAAEHTWDILKRNLGQSADAVRAEAGAYFRFRGVTRALRSDMASASTLSTEEA